MKFEERLAARADAVQADIDQRLAELGRNRIADAMRHAMTGGKRLRALLVLESAAIFGDGGQIAMPAAFAVEAIHAYSLVHDDLPAMDDDDLRRGQPTVHVKWDEATAILVGDALQSLAFEVLAREGHEDGAVRAELCGSLASAAGARGMVLGQAQDIAAETAERPLTLDEITTLQGNKTGALIRWSATVGAKLAGTDPAPLDAYASRLGLAFQIADDILDVEGDEAKAGKKLKKDAEAGKATFVTLLGLEGAKARARALVAEAEEALSPYGVAAANLKDAARFAISRAS